MNITGKTGFLIPEVISTDKKKNFLTNYLHVVMFLQILSYSQLVLGELGEQFESEAEYSGRLEIELRALGLHDE